MISLILLMPRLVEATNEDKARPKVTRGPSITPIGLPLQTGIPTYQAADQEGKTHSLIHPAIEEQNGICQMMFPVSGSKAAHEPAFTVTL
jgi:hypothetical protein